MSFDTLVTGQCSIGLSSVVASREGLLEAGLFNPRFIRCEDYDLWIRMAQCGHKIAFSRDVQVWNRLFNGLSSDFASMREARLEVYRTLACDDNLTAEQRQLVKRQIARTKAQTQLAEAKMLLASGKYRESRAAARSANSELQSRGLRLFIFALGTAPALILRFYRVYGLVVSMKKAMRVAILCRKYPVRRQLR